MGLLESQNARLARKAQPRITSHLVEGETVQVAAIAREGSPRALLILSLVIFTAIWTPLAVLGPEENWLTRYLSSAFAIVVGIAATTAPFNRWIVLTDRRVLFFRVHPLRSRPTSFVESHARWAVRQLGDGRSAGFRVLRYRRPSGSTVTFGFALGWDQAYAELRRALPPAQPVT